MAVSAFFVSGLTMFSGFGLGTLLLPVFALFFPVELAVAATAVVHAANNLLKALLLGRLADWSIVGRFGLPAIPAAFLGATALGFMSSVAPIAQYTLGGREAVITPINLVMGALMAIFAAFELAPWLRRLEFDRRFLPLGGLVSGFFGGLSGHQGALRAAFLAKVGVTAEGFVGTNAVITLMVDVARITVYGAIFLGSKSPGVFEGKVGLLVLTGMIAAFTGVLFARRWIHKITMKAVQTLTGVMVLGIALALAVGLV